MSNPPIITFWNSSGDKISDSQINALKTMLKLVGAISVKKRSDGTVQAKFKTWKTMEKVNKDVLTPLQMLFKIKTIDSSFSIVKL